MASNDSIASYHRHWDEDSDSRVEPIAGVIPFVITSKLCRSVDCFTKLINSKRIWSHFWLRFEWILRNRNRFKYNIHCFAFFAFKTKVKTNYFGWTSQQSTDSQALSVTSSCHLRPLSHSRVITIGAKEIYRNRYQTFSPESEGK